MMDAAALAQTLVNVAQGLLQGQERHAGPWLQQDDRPGLLGAAPGQQGGAREGHYPGQVWGREPRRRGEEERLLEERDWESIARASGGQQEWRRDRKMTAENRTQSSAKSLKNYLPKIKEDGCPLKYFEPNYNMLDRDYLCCYLCDKKMWDSRSYVNHIKGLAHNRAVEGRIKGDVELVAAVREELKARNSKSAANTGQKCGMCELEVKDILKHRKSDSHQQLRRFIHPHCGVCRADFEDRGDWYYHQFSGPHLAALQEVGEQVQYDPLPSSEVDTLLSKLLGKATNITKNKNKRKFVDDEEVMIVEESGCRGDGKKDLDKEMELIGPHYVKPVEALYCKLCKQFFLSSKKEMKSHCEGEHHQERVADFEGKSIENIKRKSAAYFFPPAKKHK